MSFKINEEVKRFYYCRNSFPQPGTHGVLGCIEANSGEQTLSNVDYLVGREGSAKRGTRVAIGSASRNPRTPELAAELAAGHTFFSFHSNKIANCKKKREKGKKGEKGEKRKRKNIANCIYTH